MPKVLSLNSEIERMRASSESAHRYAVLCDDRTEHDRERMVRAIVRLSALVSVCADLSRQLAALEREVLDIADVLT